MHPPHPRLEPYLFIFLILLPSTTSSFPPHYSDSSSTALVSRGLLFSLPSSVNRLLLLTLKIVSPSLWHLGPPFAIPSNSSFFCIGSPYFCPSRISVPRRRLIERRKKRDSIKNENPHLPPATRKQARNLSSSRPCSSTTISSFTPLWSSLARKYCGIRRDSYSMVRL